MGRTLLAAIVEEACGAGYRVLRLDTNKRLHSAIALYRSAGFREVAPYPESEVPEQYYSGALFMEYGLDR